MAEPQIFATFPTPIFTYKAEDAELEAIQNEIQTIVDKLESNNLWTQNEEWDSSTHYLSNGGNFEKNILEEENMTIVSDFIMKQCARFMQEMQVKSPYKPALVTSWLTLTKPGQHAHIHDHGTNQISGVYWFKTNGRDGEIFFRNPLKALKCNPIGHTNMNETIFNPDLGRLAMWPSYLDHGVKENKSDGDRISLSFNIVIERCM